MIRITIANANLNHIVQSATLKFGGCTAIETYGGWIDDDGKEVYEKGIQIGIIADSKLDIIQWIKDYARNIGEQCVVIEDPSYDHAGYFSWIEQASK